MAKRCLDKIIVDGVDYPLMQLNDFSIFNNYTGWDTNCSNAGYSYISSYGSDIMAIGEDRWISYGEHKYWDIENSNDAFIGLIGFNRNVSTKNICFDENDLDCRTRNSYVSSNQNMNMWCTIIVDDETELGFAIIVRQFPNGGTKDAWIYNDSNNDYAYCKKIYQCFGNVAQKITSNGGGATHIAKRTGQLKDLSSNLSDILMVSGGGGGGLLVGETEYTGKEAGGISGSGDNSADQSTGNAFGQGESGTDVSGGGSGLYGGYKGTSSKSGGAGSGYIGNSLLSNKKMVGYNVPTSSAEGTKTESVNVYSASGESNKPKAGDGKVKIKFINNHSMEINANSDFYDRLHGKSPQVLSGTMGTYQQASQSYYFNDFCYWLYDSGLTKAQIQGASKITFDMELQVLSTSTGYFSDTVIGLSGALDYYAPDWTVTCVISNGPDEIQREDYELAVINGNETGWEWQELAPGDEFQDVYQNLKYIFTLESGVVKKIQVYRNSTLYKETTINLSLNLNKDFYYFGLGMIDKSNLKSMSVSIE